MIVMLLISKVGMIKTALDRGGGARGPVRLMGRRDPAQPKSQCFKIWRTVQCENGETLGSAIM